MTAAGLYHLKEYDITKATAGKEPSAKTEKTNYAAQQPFQGVNCLNPFREYPDVASDQVEEFMTDDFMTVTHVLEGRYPEPKEIEDCTKLENVPH